MIVRYTLIYKSVCIVMLSMNMVSKATCNIWACKHSHILRNLCVTWLWRVSH